MSGWIHLSAEGTVCQLYQTQLAEPSVTYTCPAEQVRLDGRVL